MRIIVLTPTFFPIVGGAEVGLDELYSRIAANHDVLIIARNPSDDEVRLYARDGWTSIESRRNYSVKRFTPPWANLKVLPLRRLLASTGLDYIYFLAKEIHLQRPDVVNLQFIRPHGLVTVLLRLLGIRSVVSLVGRSDVVNRQGRLARAHGSITLAFASAITQNSDYYTDGTRWSQKAQTISYGVGKAGTVSTLGGARIRLGIRIDSKVILTVQRLDKLKHVEQTIALMRRPPLMNDPEIHLIVAGSGPELPAIRRLAETDQRISVLGFVEDAALEELYSESDLYVSHSMSETFGITYAEAMNAGLPVVAADASCSRYVIPTGCGEVFRPFDLDDYARAVASYIYDDAKRTTASAAAAQFARENFDWDVIAQQHVTVLSNL